VRVVEAGRKKDLGCRVADGRAAKGKVGRDDARVAAADDELALKRTEAQYEGPSVDMRVQAGVPSMLGGTNAILRDVEVAGLGRPDVERGRADKVGRDVGRPPGLADDVEGRKRVGVAKLSRPEAAILRRVKRAVLSGPADVRLPTEGVLRELAKVANNLGLVSGGEARRRRGARESALASWNRTRQPSGAHLPNVGCVAKKEAKELVLLELVGQTARLLDVRAVVIAEAIVGSVSGRAIESQRVVGQNARGVDDGRREAAPIGTWKAECRKKASAFGAAPPTGLVKEDRPARTAVPHVFVDERDARLEQVPELDAVEGRASHLAALVVAAVAAPAAGREKSGGSATATTRR
jgi:hypothetical protein